MSDDPSGNTEAFRAFVRRDEPAPPTRSAVPLIVVGALGLVVVLAVILIIALR
jgi:hypothetical protein